MIALISGKFICKKDPLQDLLSSLNAVISTNESTQFITVHVIYNPAYTCKFQLKTTYIQNFEKISQENIFILVCARVLFRDSVSGTNFDNFLQFRDFKIIKAKIRKSLQKSLIFLNCVNQIPDQYKSKNIDFKIQGSSISFYLDFILISSKFILILS